jgi:hypothetical protein
MLRAESGMPQYDVVRTVISSTYVVCWNIKLSCKVFYFMLNVNMLKSLSTLPTLFAYVC